MECQEVQVVVELIMVLEDQELVVKEIMVELVILVELLAVVAAVEQQVLVVLRVIQLVVMVELVRQVVLQDLLSQEQAVVVDHTNQDHKVVVEPEVVVLAVELQELQTLVAVAVEDTEEQQVLEAQVLLF
jgi:hypothetical protein